MEKSLKKKTVETAQKTAATAVTTFEPVGKVLGKTNKYVSGNPINKAVISVGTDKKAIGELFNIEKDDDGVYKVHDENSTGAQGFLKATFKTLLSVFGYDKEQAIKEAEEAERIQREAAEKRQEEEHQIM